VNASFWGCKSGQGPGKGLPANETCGGSGAAYANNGGVSANRTVASADTCVTAFKESTNYSRSYGRFDDMTVYEGSGGGVGIGTLGQGGRGGGYIWI